MNSLCCSIISEMLCAGCTCNLMSCGVDWRSGRAPYSGYTGCEFESNHYFIYLKALGKLLTINVQLLDPGDEWVPCLGQYLAFCAFNNCCGCIPGS